MAFGKCGFYKAFERILIVEGKRHENEGFSFIYPMVMSLLIFGGSVELITVGFLLGALDSGSQPFYF